MNSTRVTKVARNPKRRVAAKRRKLSAKQIAAGFGGKRRKGRARNVAKHKARAKSNPRVVYKTKVVEKIRYRKPRKVKVKRKRHHKRNPALVMSLGPINPHRAKRKVKVVKGKKRNYTMAKKRAGKRNKRRVHVKRRRNPSVFGQTGVKDLATIGGGIILGVSAAKLIPPMLDGVLGDNANSLPVKVIVTGAVAFGAGMLAKKVLPGPLGDAVVAGGLAQTVSMALNGIMPDNPLKRYVTLSGGRGVGDFLPTPGGRLTLPWNPVGGSGTATPGQLATAAVTNMAAGKLSGLAFAR